MQVSIKKADPARILLNTSELPHTTNRALKLAQRELELSSPEELDSSSSSSGGDAKNRVWLRLQGAFHKNRSGHQPGARSFNERYGQHPTAPPSGFADIVHAAVRQHKEGSFHQAGSQATGPVTARGTGEPSSLGQSTSLGDSGTTGQSRTTATASQPAAPNTPRRGAAAKAKWKAIADGVKHQN